MRANKNTLRKASLRRVSIDACISPADAGLMLVEVRA